MLNVEFQNFSLELLRALLAFALELGDLAVQVLDLLILLPELSGLLFGHKLANVFLYFGFLGIDSAGHLEIEFPGTLLQRSFFLSQQQLRPACLLSFSPQLGKLFAQELNLLCGFFSALRSRHFHSPFELLAHLAAKRGFDLCTHLSG